MTYNAAITWSSSIVSLMSCLQITTFCHEVQWPCQYHLHFGSLDGDIRGVWMYGYGDCDCGINKVHNAMTTLWIFDACKELTYILFFMDANDFLSNLVEPHLIHSQRISPIYLHIPLICLGLLLDFHSSTRAWSQVTFLARRW